MIIFTGEQRVAEANRAAFEAAMAEFCQQVRELEPDVVLYEAARCPSEPGKYIVIEMYKDQAAVDHHGAAAHFQAALAKIGPLIEAINVARYETY